MFGVLVHPINGLPPIFHFAFFLIAASPEVLQCLGAFFFQGAGVALKSMGNVNEIVVKNKHTGDLETIDLNTGEIVASSNYLPDEPVYQFKRDIALRICQEVKNGRTLLDIGNDPEFPPLHIISFWQRSERMFQEELIIARKQRSEVYHDKVLEIADNAANLRYTSKEDISNANLAAKQYQWAAERGNPERYGNKVTHEGSEEKPITMRVINTGINRHKPDIETEAKEIVHEQEEPEQRDEDPGASGSK